MVVANKVPAVRLATWPMTCISSVNEQVGDALSDERVIVNDDQACGRHSHSSARQPLMSARCCVGLAASRGSASVVLAPRRSARRFVEVGEVVGASAAPFNEKQGRVVAGDPAAFLHQGPGE